VRSLLAVAMFCLLPPTIAWARPRVAVQPFGGPETEPYRRQVAKIVGRHGYRVVTSLRAVSGTGQYPGLAKEKALKAFVVAHADDKGKRIILSFLVWQGIDGNVIGRWEVSSPKKQMARRIARDFWRRLGPAISMARAPFPDEPPPAPPMRINAGPPTKMVPARRKRVRPATGHGGPKPMAVSL
jgi:hypothetical protein